jgi:hypothetical protein
MGGDDDSPWFIRAYDPFDNLAACRTWGESVSCGVFTLRETGV